MLRAWSDGRRSNDAVHLASVCVYRYDVRCSDLLVSAARYFCGVDVGLHALPLWRHDKCGNLFIRVEISTSVLLDPAENVLQRADISIRPLLHLRLLCYHKRTAALRDEHAAQCLCVMLFNLSLHEERICFHVQRYRRGGFECTTDRSCRASLHAS